MPAELNRTTEAKALAGSDNHDFMTSLRTRQTIEGAEFAQINLNKTVSTQFALPSAPTAEVNATAGNLNGTYWYAVSFVNALGETGNWEATANAAPSGQQVNLSAIPTGPTGTTARKIYRGKNTGYDLHLVATIPDNTTTTLTDNVADATADAAAKIPRNNTTGGCRYLNDTLNFTASDLSTIVGFESGATNSGIENTFLGYRSGRRNTFGYWLTFAGHYAGEENTTGFENCRYGFRNGRMCTTGYYNSSFGVAADQANVTGIERTNFGYVAGRDGTVSGDTNFGAYAGASLTTGGKNATYGVRAGAFRNDGVTALLLAESSTYLGADTYSGQADADHEIVIGADAKGGGSYTTAIGTTEQLSSLIYGRMVLAERAWDPNNTVLRLQPIASTLARGTGIRMQFFAQPTDQNTLFDSGSIYAKWDGSTYNTERLTIQSAVDGTLTDTMTFKQARVGIGENTPDYKLDVSGPIGWKPGASVTPVDIGHIVAELTDNNTLTWKAKGSDGTVRSGTLTLSP